MIAACIALGFIGLLFVLFVVIVLLAVVRSPDPYRSKEW